ncbi:MAG: helix-turn-helix domain-containing protein [Chromatiaceae bacterium]
MQSQVSQAIARNVRTARKSLRLTQTELSLRVRKTAGGARGLCQASISAIERANRCPSVALLLLLAKALEVPVPALLEGADVGLVKGRARVGDRDGTTARV